MADIADDGNDAAELFRSLALKHRAVIPEHSGKCLYCYTPVPAPRRFCDSECRAEYKQQNYLWGRR